jgi:hypothetical protein
MPYPCHTFAPYAPPCIHVNVGDSPGMYVEGAIEGQAAGTPALVRKATVIFNRLRGEALPRTASRDLILKAAADHG